ncbi:beta-phosphoglucomutase family hydrolase [Rodentibacter caecimuris]|uniref:Beta-phosphoglucomutase family hydrolase n=1 Tax=Rodentibacter caecimuris TaxID=1796644 RepID=A0ABX3L0R3_9PAST|nr:hypothetical protein BKG89_05085 [Rodentibacter heylii]
MLDSNTVEQYAGFVFDMDGTLIDTMPIHAKAWHLTGKFFNYDFDCQIMYQLGGATVTTIAQAIMQKAGMPLEQLAAVIQKKRELSYQLVPQESTLLPTFDLVKKYYGVKPMTIGSGSHRAMIDLLMEKLQIEHYFNGIISADDVQAHKPNPETFLRCAEIMRLNAQQCLVFEDADLGVQAGLAAGMDVFDVRTGKLIRC